MIFCWLIFVFCFSFYVSWDSVSNQQSILTFLLSFWLIIKLYHYCYGFITLNYITNLHCRILFHIIVSMLFSIFFLILFLFSFSIYYFNFHYLNCSWSCVAFAVLSRNCGILLCCIFIFICYFYYFFCTNFFETKMEGKYR